MIIDRLDKIGLYAVLNSSFAKAAQWLRETSLEELPFGRAEIAGESVFATLAENRLSAGTPAFEAHRRYADIQLILGGKERFLLGTKARILPPEPGSDFYPCEAQESLEFVLGQGQFVVFLPGEAHSPGNAAEGGPETCRKLVVKVLIPEAGTNWCFP